MKQCIAARRPTSFVFESSTAGNCFSIVFICHSGAPKSLEIVPSDVYSSQNHEGKNYWSNVSKEQLLDIFRFTFQYLIFSQVNKVLVSTNFSYHYVLPYSADMSRLTINQIVAKNPPFCIQVLNATALKEKALENLFHSIRGDTTPVFLRILFESNQELSLDITPPISYAFQVLIPPDLVQRVNISESNFNHVFNMYIECSFMVNTEQSLLSRTYVSIEELKENFFIDSIMISNFVELSLALQSNQRLFRDCSINWKAMDFSSFHIQISSSCSLQILLAISTDGIVSWKPTFLDEIGQKKLIFEPLIPFLESYSVNPDGMATCWKVCGHLSNGWLIFLEYCLYVSNCLGIGKNGQFHQGTIRFRPRLECLWAV